MSDLKNPLSDFSVEINENKKSICWRHFGSLVLTKDGKRKKIDLDNNYCKPCLEKVKLPAEEDAILQQPFAR